MGSLNREAQDSGSPVRVHCLSPGMVLTDLLLAGATARNKQVGLRGSRLPCMRPGLDRGCMPCLRARVSHVAFKAQQKETVILWTGYPCFKATGESWSLSMRLLVHIVSSACMV